ncbi:hypothetical protein HMPREF0058_0226 [Actinomyces urogenitalis DSM 15434]|uniref:PemK-like protein n=1 Tax=Actinomyces urogenitalis DSM 15434 TaxID=525246 RepID=C0W2Y2_9ACTO|nr:type II toxin-antitoxin system PemK/MazF family toxin [Actinomyces urogenitalis]EEH66922.1 hypothetical protein HMPREF0058_0226 [Actinomyces urogenitalis DSM 15434]MDK8834859.1 type II toxin-antitoxin system PemK/MazF family toxin [Actinomyces urogenitalis]
MRLGQVLGALARLLSHAAPREETRTESRTEQGTGAPRGQRPVPRGGAASARTTTRPRSASPTTPASTSVLPYDVASLGLPDFVYAPDPDGDADPGEVVWTWVPYEEDASRGKDRPVLVLAREHGRLVVAQMTSKDHDHDAEQEARWGRYWHDVGSGAWDRQGRPSEVRLDRLLVVDPDAVRREGATMDRGTFNGVVAALRAHWAGR